MERPLVTISIPTFNSEVFLRKCLQAIKKQTYKKIEINIIDGGSKDKTIAIAKKFKVKILKNSSSLMSARLDGVKAARGEFVLLLDSDQILGKNIISKCIDMAKKEQRDMIVLEEDVYKNTSLLEHLFHYDRKLVHTVIDLNPYTSVLLPRFYKKSLLVKAYGKVPRKVIASATPQDHAILYLESWKLSHRIGIVRDAVKHIEPSSMILLWKKFFRWGYYSINTQKTRYDVYFQKRTERFRIGLFQKGLMLESIASIILLLSKGIPYKTGYYVAKIRCLLQKDI